MPPPPRMHKHNATIIKKKLTRMIPKLEKKTFHWLVEVVETNPLVYNTLHFDQYSHLTTLLNIFWFSAKITKIDLKFDKSF